MNSNAPIGIFDSGVGGLSILQQIRTILPYEHLCYFADTAYAPYGEKDEKQIIDRSLTIVNFLIQQGVKALIIACNTATTTAIQTIRLTWPQFIIIGIEPGLRPAAKQSKNGIVGVLATSNTLASKRFVNLCQQISIKNKVKFYSQACIGLADQIEKTEIYSPITTRLIKLYITPIIEQGADTLVLGCTHYSFIRNLIVSIIYHAGVNISIIDTNIAVIRQFIQLLTFYKLQRTQKTAGSLLAYTTANTHTLTFAFHSLLQLSPTVKKITKN